LIDFIDEVTDISMYYQELNT